MDNYSLYYLIIQHYLHIYINFFPCLFDYQQCQQAWLCWFYEYKLRKLFQGYKHYYQAPHIRFVCNRIGCHLVWTRICSHHCGIFQNKIPTSKHTQRGKAQYLSFTHIRTLSHSFTVIVVSSSDEDCAFFTRIIFIFTSFSSVLFTANNC